MEINSTFSYLLHEGMLYDIKMSIYTNDYYKTIDLYVAGEFEINVYCLNDLICHFKKMFEHLSGFDKDVKNNINSFVDEFRERYEKFKLSFGFFNSSLDSLIVFANHFNKKGTLDFSCFNIAQYKISFKDYRKSAIGLSQKTIKKNRYIALNLRGESASVFEDIYIVLEFRLNRTFSKLEAIDPKFNTINFKFIQITKIKNEKPI